jgi:hypothetical protein
MSVVRPSLFVLLAAICGALAGLAIHRSLSNQASGDTKVRSFRPQI